MIFDFIEKFIFPSRCVICDKVLPFGDKLSNNFLCDECKDKLEFIKEPTCKKCGAMISDKNENYCIRCSEDFHNNFEYGFSLLRYNDYVRKSLHKIKYEKRKEYLYFYGKMIVKAYHNRFDEIGADCFIPVPIHKSRLRERNFNQSAILAKVISENLLNYGIDIPVNENIIFRSKKTDVLNKYSKEERTTILDDAFSINSAPYIEKAIIVDDIYTTGSTIDRISMKLKEAGIKNIYFVTISIVDNL
ncbi:MAG: ComF family protein [Lachnospiraceae bacterium]|nr:ComF family protein [Lachnospiraceae bacterium]